MQKIKTDGMQKLFDLIEKDLKEGKITINEARELLEMSPINFKTESEPNKNERK